MDLDLLDPWSDSWPGEMDRLRHLLGAPSNPALFPPQFVKVAFPRLGGQVASFRDGDKFLAAGFLFPRNLRDGRREFTMRLHRLNRAATIDMAELLHLLDRRLEGSRFVLYDPAEKQSFERTGQPAGELEIGRPDEAEAWRMRELQQEIWRSEPDLLYPADIHSAAFQLGTSLVARQDGAVAGFLFGFAKFGGSALPAEWTGLACDDLRVESQVLGVSPGCRARGVGFILKKAQAEQAQEKGIDVVNWTVDPLQYANAVLNFSKLRALAFHFHPDYYPIRNALNQVPASRLAITWLVNSRRVQQALYEQTGRAVVDLHEDRRFRRVNSGYSETYPGDGAEAIAIEIPADWTALQNSDLARALLWRQTTDSLFQRYLGTEQGRYVVYGVGEDGERRYLLAERVGEETLERLRA